MDHRQFQRCNACKTLVLIREQSLAERCRSCGRGRLRETRSFREAEVLEARRRAQQVAGV